MLLTLQKLLQKNVQPIQVNKRKCIFGSCPCIDSGVQCTETYVKQEYDSMAFNEIGSNDQDQHFEDGDDEDDKTI